MARNPARKAPEPELPPTPAPPKEGNKDVQVVEREITIGLLNDKLNYLTGIVHKIAEACECDLSD